MTSAALTGNGLNPLWRVWASVVGFGRTAVAKKLNAAYAQEDYAAAKLALNTLQRELMDRNPSAAGSLGEGMEETLTVHRLHVPMQLRKTLASTNVIELAFSIVEGVCRNVSVSHF